MNKETFWEIIDASYEQANGNSDTQIAILVTMLQDYSPEDIIEFEKRFRELVIEADTYDVMAAMKIIEGYVSDDPWLYFRCWVISRGSKFFDIALNNTDALADYELADEFTQLEELMYVTTEAYALKTGKEEDETFPRDVAYAAGLDYDFGAPETTGTDWEEEDLPTRLPQLWKNFN